MYNNKQIGPQEKPAGYLAGEVQEWGQGGRGDRRRELGMADILKILRRRRYGIGFSLCISLLLMLSLYLFQTPEYHATSLISIKDDKSPNDMLQAILGPDAAMDINASKKDEVIFKSLPIADRAIKELERNKQQPLELFSERPYRNPVASLVAGILPTGQTHAGEQEEAAEKNAELERQKRVLRLSKRIRVEPVKDANMLKISVASPFADEAVLLTNTLCDVYRKADIERNSEKYQQAHKFIAESLIEQKAKVAEADRALAAFMTRNEIYEVSGNTQQLLEKMVDADARYNAVQAEYNTVKNSLGFLEKKLSEADRSISAQIAQSVNTKLGGIMDEIRGMETEYVNLLKAKGADSEEAKLQKQRLEEVKSRYRTLERSSIAGEIGYAGRARKFGFDMVSEKLQIERRLDELGFSAGEYARIRKLYENQLSLLPGKQQEFLKLQRERDVATNTYVELKDKFDETRIFLGSEVGGISIVGSAFRPVKPEKPTLSVIIMMGFFLGVLVSVGYTYIHESLDPTVNDERFFDEIGTRPLVVLPIVDGSGRLLTSQEAARLQPAQPQRRLLKAANGELVGNVAELQGSIPLIIDSLTSPYTESIRLLRTSIQYQLPRSGPSSILISGTAMGEGKSSVCTNLAMAFALVGKKTLIIDCDLRRPSQHVSLACHLSPGLSDYLQAEEDETGVAIQECMMDDLFLISAGSQSSAPSELLASPAMHQLLDELRGRFDIILLDTPPLFLSDAAQLTDWVDGILLVTRLNYTNRKVLHDVMTDPNIRSRMLGVALIASPDTSGDGKYGKYGYS